jgi:hypothetical protein
MLDPDPDPVSNEYGSGTLKYLNFGDLTPYFTYVLQAGEEHVRRPLSAFLIFCQESRSTLAPWLTKQEARLELRSENLPELWLEDPQE